MTGAGCASVHDATPLNCPVGQQAQGGACVCASTLLPPGDAACPTETLACSLTDCADDDNPCTEPSCTEGAAACSLEPVTDSTSCDLEGETGSCVDGACIVPEAVWELGTPFRIASSTNGVISTPTVAVSDQGTALAVWFDGDLIYASSFALSEGWAEAEVIGTQVAPGRGLALAMSPGGDATLAYTRIEKASVDLRAVDYSASLESWRNPEVQSRAGAIASSPSLAITATGDAFLTWWEAPGAILYAHRGSGSAAWTSPIVVSVDDGLGKGDPFVAASDDGEGMVIYSGETSAGMATNVWVTPVGAGGVAGVPTTIDTNASEVQDTKIAAAVGGGAMAVWDQGEDVWSARLSNGTWSAPVLMETRSDDVGYTRVEGDGQGTFFALWRQNGDVRTRRFDSDTELWGDLNIFKSATRPRLHVDEGGAWLAVLSIGRVRLRAREPEMDWGSVEIVSDALPSGSPTGHELSRGADGTIAVVYTDESNLWTWVDRR